MLRAYSVEQVRRAEAALMAELPAGALMQRAVAALVAECARVLGERRRPGGGSGADGGTGTGGRGSGGVYGARVAAVAGSGDNGGDALFALAGLARRGAAVTAVLIDPDRAHAGALAAVRSAGGRVVSAAEWVPGPGLDLVLDGVVGIGGRGGLRPAAADAFARAAAVTPRPVLLAVDVPSGVDSDTGEVAGVHVQADLTVTFGVAKPGVLLSPGAGAVGELRLADIGLDPYLAGEPVLEALEAEDVAALRPHPARESNKYRRGVVGVVAGSAQYPGAAVLAVGAALRSGAGAVRYVGPAEVAARVLERHPETMVSTGSVKDAGRVQAWVVGPGLGSGLDAHMRASEVLRQEVPAVVDADALPVFSGQAKHRRAATVVTPHAGEAARLSGDYAWTAERIEAQRLAAVRLLAARHDCTVLLKGSTTLIARSEQPACRVNLNGTPVLATAGSGDVLAGLIGGLLATGMDPVDAASVGAWRHAAAGRIAAGRSGGSVVAGDLVAVLGLGPG